MTIASRALLFIGLVLAFQLALLGALDWQFRQSEQDLWQEEYARAVISESNELIQRYYELAATVALYLQTKEFIFVQRFDKLSATLMEGTVALRSLIESSPQPLATRIQMDKLSNDLAASVKDLRGSVFARPGEKQWFLDKNNKVHLVQTALQSVSADLDAIMDAARQSKVRHEKSHARGSVEKFVILAAVVNILLSVILWRSFTVRVAGRLSDLLSEFGLFAARKPLPEPMSGSDEIASLDREFRAMAHSVRQFEERKREFMMSLMHDLRAPTGAILNTLAMLEDGGYGALTSRGTMRVNSALVSCNKMIALLERMLELEKDSEGRLIFASEQFALFPSIFRTVEALRGLAEKRDVALSVESDAASPNNIFIRGDEFRIEQLLINLISNAISFSPDNASVVIKVEPAAGTALLAPLSRDAREGTNDIETIGALPRPPLSTQRPRAAVSNASVKITIIDQGPGIPDTEAARIFEPFEQVYNSARKTGGGVGLGLALCKTIIQHHGGSIKAENNGSGVGASFIVELPCTLSAET